MLYSRAQNLLQGFPTIKFYEEHRTGRGRWIGGGIMRQMGKSTESHCTAQLLGSGPISTETKSKSAPATSYVMEHKYLECLSICDSFPFAIRHRPSNWRSAPQTAKSIHSTGPGNKTVPRLREFCSCCCLPLLPGLA